MKTLWSEQKLAALLRIRILDHIGEIDLPWFLFEQIDATLSELNYYKVSNLLDNIEQYTAYLMGMAKRYNTVIKNTEEWNLTPNHRTINYEPYMTNTLYKEGFSCTLNKMQCSKLHTTFSVLCLLTMKEYINRRILQRANKQKIMTAKTEKQNA